MVDCRLQFLNDYMYNERILNVLFIKTFKIFISCKIKYLHNNHTLVRYLGEEWVKMED